MTRADWVIGPDRSPGVSAPMREVECTSCDGRSQACTEGLGPEAWAIAHTQANPEHSGFREIRTAYLRVVPAPGGALRRCDCCREHILPGEPYEEAVKFSGSGAGVTLVFHTRPCERA
ncbi:hypothetical protein ACIBCM_27640 [Streptomyces sp. NPDC051018]|uniref:DUF7848 domain-containing protein n=1 Tax=Streptomyces sp. NPDC051018 TaxID=3365639 RepID=UPI00379F7B5E